MASTGRSEALSFGGRVAVVTGAGRGMGRAHARLLAARGASVVVNDLVTASAQSVVDEITAAGGAAVASGDDISVEKSASALIDRAVTEFGRVDVLVNNAAYIYLERMEKHSSDAFDLSMRVNAYGAYFTTQAAWRRFLDQGYGRVVMISSGAATRGVPDRVGYAASKAALIGMVRTLAGEGDGAGITVNGVYPAAITARVSEKNQRMEYVERYGDLPVETFQEKTPALVSAMVAWLSHEECPVNGEIFHAGQGHFARVVIGAVPGFDTNDLDMPAEVLLDHMDEIVDRDAFVPVPTYLSRTQYSTDADVAMMNTPPGK